MPCCACHFNCQRDVVLDKDNLKSMNMIAWVHGCLSEDTEILTENGWKMWSSVFEGDYIFACDYKDDLRLELQKVFKKYIYDYDDDAYHIKDTGYYSDETHLKETDHILSKNHNILVSDEWAVGFGGVDKISVDLLFEKVQQRKEEQIDSDFYIPTLNGDVPCTIEKIKYKGKMWCVEVPTGAFVARRNGKIFITGNSGFPNFNKNPSK